MRDSSTTPIFDVLDTIFLGVMGRVSVSLHVRTSVKDVDRHGICR